VDDFWDFEVGLAADRMDCKAEADSEVLAGLAKRRGKSQKTKKS